MGTNKWTMWPWPLWPWPLTCIRMFIIYGTVCFIHLQFRFVSRTVCSSYPPLNLRRPSFPSRLCTDLEQFSAAYHICFVTSCLLLLLEDILLRTLLPIITVVMPAKWHCHLWTRYSLLLTYLMYGLSCVSYVTWTLCSIVTCFRPLLHFCLTFELTSGRLEKTTWWSPHHVAQHHPTWSETTPPYAPRSSRFGLEPPSVEDDVDIWRMVLRNLESHARNDDDDDTPSVTRDTSHLSVNSGLAGALLCLLRAVAE